MTLMRSIQPIRVNTPPKTMRSKKSNVSTSRHFSEEDKQTAKGDNFEFRKRLSMTEISEVYECKQCGIEFQDKISLMLHRKNEHCVDKKHSTCSHCRTRIPHKFLEAHLRKCHVDEDQLHCTLCLDVLNGKNALVEHMKNVHEIKSVKLLSCPQCPLHFEKVSALLSHISEHDDSHKEKPLEIHQKAIKLFHCHLCSKKFSRKSTYDLHIWKHKDGSLKKYMCHDCGKTFFQLHRMRNHIMKHLNLMPFKCGVCGREFKHTTSLKNHSLSHGDYKSFQCPHCKKAFRKDSNLKMHILHIHEQFRQFLCNICGKTFVSASSLRAHLNRHLGVKKSVCMYCSKQFENNAGLKRHLRIHTQEKPFQCQMCQKRFSQSCSVRTHMKTHTGGKPYHGPVLKIDVNGKAYQYNNTLCKNLQCKVKAPSEKMPSYVQSNEKNNYCLTTPNSCDVVESQNNEQQMERDNEDTPSMDASASELNVFSQTNPSSISSHHVNQPGKSSFKETEMSSVANVSKEPIRSKSNLFTSLSSANSVNAVLGTRSKCLEVEIHSSLDSDGEQNILLVNHQQNRDKEIARTPDQTDNLSHDVVLTSSYQMAHSLPSSPSTILACHRHEMVTSSLVLPTTTAGQTTSHLTIGASEISQQTPKPESSVHPPVGASVTSFISDTLHFTPKKAASTNNIMFPGNDFCVNSLPAVLLTSCTAPSVLRADAFKPSCTGTGLEDVGALRSRALYQPCSLVSAPALPHTWGHVHSDKTMDHFSSCTCPSNTGSECYSENVILLKETLDNPTAVTRLSGRVGLNYLCEIQEKYSEEPSSDFSSKEKTQTKTQTNGCLTCSRLLHDKNILIYVPTKQNDSRSFYQQKQNVARTQNTLAGYEGLADLHISSLDGKGSSKHLHNSSSHDTDSCRNEDDVPDDEVVNVTATNCESSVKCQTGKSLQKAISLCPVIKASTISAEAEKSSSKALPAARNPDISPNKTSLKCTLCGKKCTSNAQMTNHKKNHRSQEKVPCSICGKQFCRSYLRVHIESVHSSADFSCEQCHKVFKRSKDLRSHSRAIHGDFVRECNICLLRFPEKDYKNHYKLEHPVKNQYSCTYCSKSFNKKYNLKVHIMHIHTKERAHQCSVCGKCFVTRGALRVHIRHHTGDKPYTCSICEKQFVCCTSLKRHQRIHTNERPFACPICDKKFTQSGSVKIHMRTHTGEKPHACHICQNTYAQMSCLRAHIKSHRASLQVS